MGHAANGTRSNKLRSEQRCIACLNAESGLTHQPQTASQKNDMRILYRLSALAKLRKTSGWKMTVHPATNKKLCASHRPYALLETKEAAAKEKGELRRQRRKQLKQLLLLKGDGSHHNNGDNEQENAAEHASSLGLFCDVHNVLRLARQTAVGVIHARVQIVEHVVLIVELVANNLTDVLQPARSLTNLIEPLILH